MDQCAQGRDGAINGRSAWRCEMPLEAIVVSIALVAIFGGYAALLGWGLWYTRRA
jgi:hypothetical protein